MAFKIVRNDITKMHVDAIVNTANPEVTYGEGIDYAVYQAAGEEQLLDARRILGEMEEGDAGITSGFSLPAKYIIHAVSPLYMDGEQGEPEKLHSCYRKSMELAAQYQCRSLALPLISTGSYGYPKEEAMRIAVDEIHAFLLHHDMLIYLVVFDDASANLGRRIYPDLEAYIDSNYVSDAREKEYGDKFFGQNTAPTAGRRRLRQKPINESIVSLPADDDVNPERLWDDPDESPRELSIGYDDSTEGLAEDYEVFLEEKHSALERRMRHLADRFQEYMFYLMSEKHLSGVDVYKRAIISKQTFSKIRNNPAYHPDKATAMRLCIGCRLSLDETRDLLARAGYALSPCDKRDVIFSYFIEKGVYDMVEIDIALEEHGLPCFIT